VDGDAVRSVEVDRLVEAQERADAALDAGGARVRHRDRGAQARRAEPFAGREAVENGARVDSAGRFRKHRAQEVEGRLLAADTLFAANAAGSKNGCDVHDPLEPRMALSGSALARLPRRDGR